MPGLSPFADIEDMLNRDTVGMLANATATWQGGEPFGVLFVRKPAGVFGGDAVDMASCTVGYCVANTPGMVAGAELVIGGVAYKVTGQVQPDAGGWVDLTVYAKG